MRNTPKYDIGAPNLSIEAVLLLTCLFGVISLYATLAKSSVAAGVHVYAATAAICAILLSLVVFPHMTDAVQTTFYPGAPWIGAHFRIDQLGRLFLLVINSIGAIASIFAIGYGQYEKRPGRITPFYPLFIAAMNFVVLSDDAFTFMVSWEAMSLFSWALVLAHHENPVDRKAAFVYLLMASFGGFCLLLAFAALGGAIGDYSFSAIRAAAKPSDITSFAILLTILGAGSKAGLAPLHIWLPLAHPAAPSHVSGLMSGVMTKIAVFAFIRIIFDLISPINFWWSIPPMALGAVSIFVGASFAYIESDFKRLLAYSTIENIGVIFISLGLALAFRCSNMPVASALALTAGLFHVINHALFKSALFFGAGAVQNATGARSIERLGGLIRTMPKLTPVFLIACLAISALPPLNGFVSEWLLFQGILLSPSLPQPILKFFVPAIGVTLAFGAALGAGVYIRLFGVAFLGRPRSSGAESAKDPDHWSFGAIVILITLCVLTGLIPGPIIDALSPVTEQLVSGKLPLQTKNPWLSIAPIETVRSSYNGLLVLSFFIISGVLAFYFVRRRWPSTIRRAPPWDCGYVEDNPLAQYSASSFAQPVRRALGGISFSVGEHLDMPLPGDVRPARYGVEIMDRANEFIFLPLAGAIDRATSLINRFNFLTIQQYLAIVFATLIILLLLVAL